jgi:uncharacterized membrane protein YphA (DoxX/SURF4 family)
MLREAFSGQLTVAELPLHGLNMWLVPLAEVLVGLMLLAGFLTRVAILIATAMMLVATYVHLVVRDPALFPLQAQAPVVPIVVLILCVFLLWTGGGSWSVDLKSGGTRG